MKIICRPHNCFGGFFSQFNQTIQGLVHYYDIINQVEWNMHDVSAFCYNNDDNFRPLFVEYNNNIPSRETKIVDAYIDVSFTAHFAADKYTCVDQKWRDTYYKAYKKFIKHTDLVDSTFEEIYQKQFQMYKDVPKIGILIRNNHLSTEQPNRVSPTKEQYIDAINSFNLKEFVVVCAIDNNEDLNYFKDKYNIIYNKNTTRTATAYDLESHRNGSVLNVKDTINHYLEGVALSKCDYFIHPVSNVATAALYMNPSLKNLFLIG